MSFWNTLDSFFALAPMEDVTDTVFREMVLRNTHTNKMNVVFSEFLSTDGFCHPIGREKVSHRFFINDSELELLKQKDVKLVAQIWGTDPKKFAETAEYITNHTPFDGIDINMGCPQKNIIKKGACSALINTPELAKEIIHSTINATTLPVSVKTRIGFKSVNTEEWATTLLSTPIKALTVHGRTQKMMSDGVADWNEIRKVVDLRNKLGLKIPIIGNGDVTSIDDGNTKISDYLTDGVMVGRGIFSDFWFFSNKKEVSIEDKLSAMLLHAELYHNTWEGQKPWVVLRRFFKIYTYHLPQAAKLRDGVMNTNSLEELKQIIFEYRKTIDALVD
ncbi:tRNA dihydrouridine synthase [Saccharicrinis aurantiacus]|uniref:tRNA dihydrouridine synthase n=1 Tax=Saccharicrinis aurantiacus TaxID=1849719 RepID=UPI000837EE04|nr:tRNA-dihydrouridine synthase [Saccharicrinis aurantiacus]